MSLLSPGQKGREFFLLGLTGRPSTIQPERPAVVLGACSIQSRPVGGGLGKAHSLGNGSDKKTGDCPRVFLRAAGSALSGLGLFRAYESQGGASLCPGLSPCAPLGHRTRVESYSAINGGDGLEVRRTRRSRVSRTAYPWQKNKGKHRDHRVKCSCSLCGLCASVFQNSVF